MRSSSILEILFLLLFLPSISLAESGKLSVVGTCQDGFMTVATVAVVELGHDRYLAISVKSNDKAKESTHLVTRTEVDKLIKMGDAAAHDKSKVKEGEFVILSSFAGNNEGIAFVRAKVDGVTLTALQVTEDGRENGFWLKPKSWQKLRTLIKQGKRKL